MKNNYYVPELKEKVLQLYLEEGRTNKSFTEESNILVNQYRNGTILYNCRIIDLCGRNVVVTLDSNHTDTEFVKRTV